MYLVNLHKVKYGQQLSGKLLRWQRSKFQKGTKHTHPDTCAQLIRDYKLTNKDKTFGFAYTAGRESTITEEPWSAQSPKPPEWITQWLFTDLGNHLVTMIPIVWTPCFLWQRNSLLWRLVCNPVPTQAGGLVPEVRFVQVVGNFWTILMC